MSSPLVSTYPVSPPLILTRQVRLISAIFQIKQTEAWTGHRVGNPYSWILNPSGMATDIMLLKITFLRASNKASLLQKKKPTYQQLFNLSM